MGDPGPRRIVAQICRFNTRPGGCRYGANCRYSHADHPETRHNYATTGRPEWGHGRGRYNWRESGADTLSSWQRLTPTNPSSLLLPLGQRMPAFLETALTLINADVEAMQQVVLKLASEGGLQRLKELLDQDFDTISDVNRSTTLHDQVLPFFKLITHPEVATSIMLEEKLVSVYNFLYGRQGERGSRVFEFAHQALITSTDDSPYSVVTLEPIFASFSSMLDFNSHALTNESIHSIGSSLLELCTQLEDSQATQLRRFTTKLKRRIGFGSMITTSQGPAKPKLAKASFVLPIDPPGALSPAGPRHDNDHEDIGDIQILPTFAEIKAVRPPYLPSNTPSELHLPGVKGLLDRQFRLLREDTVGQLRDAICAELDQDRSRDNQARTFTYTDLFITDISFARWKGLQLHVRFSQPQRPSQMTVSARQDWWEHSKRLQIDSLVCIIGSDDSVTFCTVTELSHTAGRSLEDGVEDTGKSRSIFSDPGHCYLQLQLVNPNEQAITQVLKQLRSDQFAQRLVEFPGVLLPTFLPTLEALQKMSKVDELPFADFIAPDDEDSDQSVIGPPAYASSQGFRFDLKDAMSDSSSCMMAVGDFFDIENFKASSVLDNAQAEALVAALNRSLALIQGPPGTGKSFTGVTLIKVLLSVAKQAQLGPILCVCYTNHALDQLLEHLIRHGVTQIIRMGSRSKSEALENCNIRRVVQKMQLTTSEEQERRQTHRALATCGAEIREVLEKLSNLESRRTIKEYLELHHREHHDQLFEDDIDNDGFQRVRNDSGNEIWSWLHGRDVGERMPSCRLSALGSRHRELFKMDLDARKRLYEYWLGEIRMTLAERLVHATQDYHETKSKHNRIQQDQELRCLQKANIIGVTTTGLARQVDLLRNLRSKVLVCEEAGEVLEAHVLTALLPSLEHVILIGDHQQLPPHIQNYKLSRDNKRGTQYSLDVSLFERLVTSIKDRPALPFSILETQRRMHPSISELIRSTLYPRLRDLPVVEDYPQVAGMKQRLFWFDHRHLEPESDPNSLVTTSFSNPFEIQMVVALVTHLVRQGVYAANDIAVLTPYLGQLLKIRKVLQNQFEITMSDGDIQELEKQGLENEERLSNHKTSTTKTALLKALAVSTIDNFQGEEAKVVIVSLVRSNKENNCGFLKSPNRINVLLSRAKHGMYIIGNSETAQSVDMWSDVIQVLKAGDNFGTQFQLECPRHPDTPISVSNPGDFVTFSPEGGCGKICGQRLDCGHRDKSKCHSEALHKAVKCLEPCTKNIKGCEHGCPKFCGDACPTHCNVELSNLNIKLACGHTKNELPCWQVQNPELVRCTTTVQRTVPVCGHKVKENCFRDVSSDMFQCNAVCGALLPCGHSCSKDCHQCTRRLNGALHSQDHGQCQKICGRKFNSCSHSCRSPCHGDRPCKCVDKCDNFCEHSGCGKNCGEPCAPCASVTCATAKCPHNAPCTMPCAAPCDWVPCSKRCEKTLVCGHRCPTVCGEICPPPQLCQQCASQDVQDSVVDLIMMSSYGETNLDDDPIVIPACGHILTISSMDGQMEMSKHYTMTNDIVDGIKENSSPFSMDELKVCSTCRGSLRNIFRYGRIVRRALLDESTKKFIRSTGMRTIELTEALQAEQGRLSETIEAVQKIGFADDVRKIGGNTSQQLNQVLKTSTGRYQRINRLRHKISEHLQGVSIEEQPFKRVSELVSYAQRNRANVGDMDSDVSVLQTRETVQVTALLIRCDLIIVSDFLNLQTAGVILDFSEEFARCETLLKLAKEAKQPRHEMEGHMFYVQYCAAQRQFAPLDKIDELMTKAREHVADAYAIHQEYPGSTRHVIKELEDVEEMLKNSTFYTTVRDDEFKEVMEAMAREFRGGGHWYTCVNGHPFTIGECGMPMEQAMCPQCGAAVGGQDHQLVEGVTRATELEERFRQMNL